MLSKFTTGYPMHPSVRWDGKYFVTDVNGLAYQRQEWGMKNWFRTDGDTTTILIVRRSGNIHELLIDTDDLPRVLALTSTISITVSGNTRSTQFYSHTAVDGRYVKFHRWLLNAPDDMSVDHIDGNGLNNRRSNIRVVTHSINMRNRKPWGPSGTRGVTFSKRSGRWLVGFNLGSFDTMEEAQAVAEDAWKKLGRPIE